MSALHKGRAAEDTYQWRSDFARRYAAQGREEGLEKGLERGRAEEAARSVLLVLGSVGATVTDSARARIEDCTDLDVLHGWLEKAAKVNDAEELFD